MGRKEITSTWSHSKPADCPSSARRVLVHADDRRRSAVVADHQFAVGPRPVRTPLAKDGAARPAVDPLRPHHRDIAGQRQRAAEGGEVAQAFADGLDYPVPATGTVAHKVIEASLSRA